MAVGRSWEGVMLPFGGCGEGDSGDGGEKEVPNEISEV